MNFQKKYKAILNLKINFNKYVKCAYCKKEKEDGNELCKDCIKLAINKEIIKNDKKQWVKRERTKEELNFYDPEKKYYIKIPVLNRKEEEFFEYTRKYLDKNFIITPQVNLQTIIETDTRTRNNELFRSLDFVIFNKEYYIPMLAIELNGKHHYTKEYWKKRDNSIKEILKSCELELIEINMEEFDKINKNFIDEINKKINKIYNENLKEIKELIK